MTKQLGAFLVMSASIALAGCAAQLREEPEYPLSACRQVAITDAATGEAVIGAEDFAFDRANGRLFVSAYDRRAVEAGARRNSATLAEGGVYVLPIDKLRGEAREIAVESILPRGAIYGGLRPHGVSFDAAAQEIAFVNRGFHRDDGKWRMTATIERWPSARASLTASDSAKCSANDVVSIAGRLLASYDHAACGWRAGVENILGGAGGVTVDDGRALIENIPLANGMAAISKDEFALASTRSRKILFYRLSGDTAWKTAELKVAGGPDNLTTNANGDVVAAAHPLLLAIGAQRRLGLGRSGSRAVKISDRKTSHLLFDDPRATLMSAATVALEEDGLLVLGSVLDPGLVVCARPEMKS